MGSRRRNDSGQALAIGVIMLLFLALGMYMVATLGKHAKEKIHVQTTADAMALSLATLEAQSFNYIAFANRTQVAHYVSMLNMQGYVSYVSSIGQTCLFTSSTLKVAYYACLAVEAVGGTCLIPSAMIDQWANFFFDTCYKNADSVLPQADRLLGSASRTLEGLNRALFVTQVAMAGTVAAHLGGQGYETFRQLTRDNDPEWQPETAGAIGNQVFAVKNLSDYLSAFHPAAGIPFPISGSLLPLGNDLGPDAYSQPDSADVARVQRMMTDVVNATRFDRAMVNRPLLPGRLGSWGFNDVVDTVAELGHLGSGEAWGGESKLINASGSGADLDAIFRSAAGDSKLNRGEVMASEDTWLWAGKGSVWVKAARSNSRFQHCAAERGLTSIPVIPKFVDCTSDRSEDPNHDFKGISPYMAYNAGAKRYLLGGESFHQPEVFVWLHKGMEQAGFKDAIKFEWQTRSNTTAIDTTIARSSGFGVRAFRGVHGIARAQAYYHRPGNWQEPPNLFNPFWRARLAPIVESGSLSDVDSFGDLAAFLAANMVFH